MSSKVPERIRLDQLVQQAAQALYQSGLDRRIDIYRDVEVDDPSVARMLGRPHRLRVRVRITASSLLHEGDDAVNETVNSGIPVGTHV